MKYIDAEKLIAEIERLGDVLNDPICQRDALGPDWVNGGKRMLKDIRSSIECLQQEQPEVDLKKHIKEDMLKYRYLEKVGGMEKEGSIYTISEFHTLTARHFYELGLNARKEE